MKILAYLLVVVFIAGLAGSFFFWPPIKDQRPAAFFSLLQFVAAFALVLLTFLYVTATQKSLTATNQQLADQNQAPHISVIQYYFSQVAPSVVNFEIEIANPSVRATSLGVKGVQIGEVLARFVCFELDQVRNNRVIVPARDLVNVVVKAENFNPPVPIAVGLKTKTVLTFEEVFHGKLTVITEV
jgi:hypothetical protein